MTYTGSGIEVVITGLTRNQFAGNRTWVRIPPAAPTNATRTKTGGIFQENPMNFVISIYKKNFLKRFDRDENIPYYSAEDFPGLICERGEFQNSYNITIKYFTYSYENPKEDKLILFCPGMGPGHSAYLAEIETLCKAGYNVLTLDYTGCGESGGSTMPSVNAPTRDATELLNLLNPDRKSVV